MKKVADPQVLKFIRDTIEYYPVDAIDRTIEENRTLYNNYSAAFRAERPKTVQCQDAYISAADGYQVPVRYYKHEKGNPFSDTIVCYIHGGGLVVGGLESHDDICAEICDRLQIDVSATDYRLMPENDYPTPLNDAASVYQHLTQNYKHIILCGDSGGAYLAACLCHLIAKENWQKPTAQVHIYPAYMTDLTSLSYVECAEAPLLRTSEVKEYQNIMLGGKTPSSKGDACCFPLSENADFSKVPPTALFSADVDPVRDDAGDYAERMKPYNNVSYQNDAQLVHGYLRARHMSDAAKKAFSDIIKAIGNFVKKSNN